MIFDEKKKEEIKQFILGNFRFENLELFINSFANRYLFLEANGKNDCEEYKNLRKLFDNLNRYPRLNEKNELFWVRKKAGKKQQKPQKEKNQFFKKGNNKKILVENEERLIRDIFWNLEEELYKIFTF